MKRLAPVWTFLAIALATAPHASFAHGGHGMPPSESTCSTSMNKLNTAMRELWEDHVSWTRYFIISALADLEDTGKVAERLLKNQDDIGNAIKPYYGEAAGNKLAALLRDHILIAADLVKAAKMQDNEALKKSSELWDANANDIAAFLSSANPGNWPKEALEEMMQAHLKFTTLEVVSRLQKNWTADIKAYDEGRMHMLMMADILTHGIAKQFPDRFRK